MWSRNSNCYLINLYLRKIIIELNAAIYVCEGQSKIVLDLNL